MQYSEYLTAAARMINERAAEYSNVDDTFRAIAEIATAMLGRPVTEFEVAMILLATTLGRLRVNPAHEDSWIDAINYTAFSAQYAPRPAPEPATEMPKSYNSILSRLDEDLNGR